MEGGVRLLLFFLFFSSAVMAHHEAGTVPVERVLAENSAGAAAFPPLERHYSVDASRNQRPSQAGWAAVARHPAQTFFVWGKATEGAAAVAARARCERHTDPADGECRVVRAFRRCASQAAALHQDFALVQEADTLAEAEAHSLEECRIKTGDACVRRWSYCADGSGQVHTEAVAWGAVARPLDGGGESILIKDRPSSEAALVGASWHCGQVNKRDCETIFHFGECGAYAESPTGDVYGWSRGSDRDLAEASALQSCNAASADACRIVLSDCNDVGL